MNEENRVKDETQLKEDLQQELTDVRQQIAALDASLDEKPEYGMGKGDPGVTRWELNHALRKRLETRLEAIEEALARMSEGSYGRCKRCGAPIHPDRLAVLPDTEICIKCAQE